MNILHTYTQLTRSWGPWTSSSRSWSAASKNTHTETIINNTTVLGKVLEKVLDRV